MKLDLKFWARGPVFIRVDDFLERGPKINVLLVSLDILLADCSELLRGKGRKQIVLLVAVTYIEV